MLQAWIVFIISPQVSTYNEQQPQVSKFLFEKLVYKSALEINRKWRKPRQNLFLIGSNGPRQELEVVKVA